MPAHSGRTAHAFLRWPILRQPPAEAHAGGEGPPPRRAEGDHADDEAAHLAGAARSSIAAKIKELEADLAAPPPPPRERRAPSHQQDQFGTGPRPRAGRARRARGSKKIAGGPPRPEVCSENNGTSEYLVSRLNGNRCPPALLPWTAASPAYAPLTKGGEARMRLQDKIAIIIGAGQGPGDRHGQRPRHRHPLRPGGRQRALRRPRPGLGAGNRDAMAAERRMRGLQADVTREADWRGDHRGRRGCGAASTCCTTMSAVSMAGGDASPTEITEEAFDRVTAVNLRGIVMAVKHALPIMRRAGGRRDPRHLARSPRARTTPTSPTRPPRRRWWPSPSRWRSRMPTTASAAT